jgi:DNA-binding cell septation regulator SpoVG
VHQLVNKKTVIIMIHGKYVKTIHFNIIIHPVNCNTKSEFFTVVLSYKVSKITNAKIF